MKKIWTILACSTILFSACSKESIWGGGAVITETRVVPAFTNVELGGSGDATITYGATQRVTVSGYENLLPVYETKVIGSILYMRFKPDIFNIKNDNVKVNITLPEFAYMRINGSGKITAKDFMNGDALTASINGSGDIFMNNSKYTKAAYSISGSGDINAATTETAVAEAKISGSGNINLKVNNKLKARISGSGNINFWGNPVSIDTQISGSGKITKK